MKSSLKVILISTIAFILLFTSVIVVKNVFVDKSGNDLVNIDHLSKKFMNKYFEDYQELSKLDNKENILIVTSKKKLKETYGATKVVKAPNYQYFLQYEDEESKKEAKSKLEDNEDLLYVEENIVRSIAESDSSIAEAQSLNTSWGIEKMGLESAIEIANSKELDEVVVAIIDTGCNLDLFNTYYEGKIKETYNAIDKSNDITDNSGHGTHIAGIIAEATPNNVKILPIKVTESEEIYSTDVIDAIYYITVNNKADIINLSLGSSEYSEAEYLAIDSAKENNIISIAAAGDDNSYDERGAEFYPASYNNTISISAVDYHLNRKYGSNNGITIDFAAPGVSIDSLGTTKDGTSMAAAHASSVVAILKSYNKNITLEDTKELLKKYAIDLGKDGYDEYFGNGFINLIGANFCDGQNCDEYNIFAENDTVNLVDIDFSEEKFTPKYDYGNETNIMNILLNFYYTEYEYYEKYLWELEDVTITGYDASSKTEQVVTISYKGFNKEITVDNSNIIAGYEYELIEDTNNIRLTRINEDYMLPLKKVLIPSSIDGYTVTNIGEDSFNQAMDIVEINMPSTIEVIENTAFYGCRYLSEVNFSENLKTIGRHAFADTSIKSIYIPKTLSNIELYAFADMPYLEKIEVDEENPVYDSRNNCNAIMESATNTLVVSSRNTIIPSDTEVIGEASFSNSKIQSIVIPDSVKEILYNAFYESDLENIELSKNLEFISDLAFANTSLKSIEIPSSVKTIGSLAFTNSKLEEVILNEGLEEIGGYAFQSNNLKEVYIPSTVKDIDIMLFDNNPNLDVIIVDKENEVYDSRNNSNTIIETATNKLIFTNKSNNIPNSVKIIGTYSIDGELGEIIIPEGVETIEKDAFFFMNNHKQTKKIMLPKSLNTIGDNVFSSFENLTLYVYKDSYALEYAKTNDIPYKIIDYKEVSVNKDELKTDYKAFDVVDTTNLSISVFYEYGEEDIREEVITEGYTIEYQNGTDSFRYGDTYFTVKGTTETGSEYEVVVEVDVTKLDIEDYITDNTEDDYTLYDNTPKKISLDIQSDLEYNIKFANEAGEYVLDESPEYTEEGTYIIKYKVYIDKNYTEYFNEIEFTITKVIYIPTVTIIKDKIYDGTNNIDLSSINIECDGLQEGDIIIESANTTTTEVGKTQARVVIKLRDELAVSYDLDQKEIMLDINILPQPVTKPTLVEKEYTYTGEQQTLELNNFNADKMNIEGNVQTNAGEHNVIVSLKNDNYIWEDETTDNVVLKYVINKRDINDCIIDNTLTPLILHDGQSHGLNLNIVSELEYVVKFANEAGEYVLDESPKYSEVGDYTIKYKVYINDNYTEYLNEKVLTITDDTIIDNTKDKEVLYDGKEHTLDIKLNIEDYEVKYSTDNQNYSTEVPKFKHVGEYNVYYKILVDDEEVITGNKKVKIYGVQKIANNIRIKENIIITKNNSFSNLISNFTIYAPHHTKGHYDNNNSLITKDVLKTTDTFVIKVTNFGNIKYNIALLGDINSDSKINSADYIKIKKHIMETEKIKENINFYAADVNNDNNISSKDYIKIRKYIMNGESL